MLERLKCLNKEIFLERPRHTNLSKVKELHANWNDNRHKFWVRGKKVPLDRESLCKFLGVDCPNPKILIIFGKTPIYKVIHHTLCITSHDFRTLNISFFG